MVVADQSRQPRHLSKSFLINIPDFQGLVNLLEVPLFCQLFSMKVRIDQVAKDVKTHQAIVLICSFEQHIKNLIKEQVLDVLLGFCYPITRQLGHILNNEFAVFFEW